MVNKRICLVCLTLFLSVILMSCSGEEDFTSCPEDDPFCFERQELLWSGISKKDMDWETSVEYCKEMGGRLPDFTEVRLLLRKCPDAQLEFSCPVRSDCLSLSCWENGCAGCIWDSSGVYSHFHDSERLWTFSEDSEDNDYAWSINFVNSYVGNMKKSELNYVRCVRD